MKHKHWIFYAYDEKNGEKLENAVEATVNDASDESEALIEVKKIVVRNNYILVKVYECTQCFYQDRNSKALAEMSKIMKGDE